MQPTEPSSPQPSPARRERGQAARRGIDSCPPAHFRRPLAVSATLFLPLSGEDGGGFAALGKIKLVQPIEPPSPQPSPAGREREQVTRRSINFCLTTVIPAQAGIHF
ncbi:MAG: hypothetical protein HXM82_01285 [Neisseria sp.]|nr:hypothetical protein [Neisseria sp.]